MSKKKVLLVSDKIAPGGGPPGYVYNLLAGIREVGETSDLSYTAWGRTSTRRNNVSERGHIVARLVSSIGGLIAAASRRLIGVEATLALRMSGSKAVILHGFQRPARARFARRAGALVVYMPHSPSVSADEYRMMQEARGADPSSEIYERLLRDESELLTSVDLLVFPCKEASEQYRLAFGDSWLPKARYIRSGISAKSAPTAPAAHDRPRVLFVGRYVPHKGYDLFVEAAEKVAEDEPHVDFFTLGTGPLKRESAVVQDLGWSDSPLEVIGSSDLVVVPNRIAYYDLLPLEVAALGKPIVFTAVGGNIDQSALLTDSILCSQSDLAIAISQALRKLEEDPRWGHRNAESFATEFTSEVMARRWTALISQELSHGQ